MLATTQWKRLARKMNFNLLLLGLSASGKKFFLNQLRGTSAGVTYNQGPVVATLQYEKLSITACLDTNKSGFGSEWRSHCQNIDAVIMIIDSYDNDRMNEAAEEVTKVLATDALKNSAILVVANKQDLSGAQSPNDVTAALGLTQLKARDWLTQGTSCTTSQGIAEGMNWLAQSLSKKSQAA